MGVTRAQLAIGLGLLLLVVLRPRSSSAAPAPCAPLPSGTCATKGWELEAKDGRCYWVGTCVPTSTSPETYEILEVDACWCRDLDRGRATPWA